MGQTDMLMVQREADFANREIDNIPFETTTTSARLDNSKPSSNRQGNTVFTKQKCDYSSAIRQAHLLSSNVFSSKEKRGVIAQS